MTRICLVQDPERCGPDGRGVGLLFPKRDGAVAVRNRGFDEDAKTGTGDRK